MKKTIKEQKIINKLIGIDMRFSRIHEMVKMRAPISVSDRDYYLLKLEGNP